MNNMLTIEEVKKHLAVEQDKIEELLSSGKLQAYKIGGAYIRFRKEDVLNLSYELGISKDKGPAKVTFGSRIFDFWRFNNFYIISLALVGALIYLVFAS